MLTRRQRLLSTERKAAVNMHAHTNTQSIIYCLFFKCKNVGRKVNVRPGASTEFPTGLVSGLVQSEPGAVLVQKNRKGYVNENKMSCISPNRLVIIPDVSRVTILPKT